MIVEKFKFAGIDYIVMDKFDYDGVTYMYIFEDISEKIKGKDISKLEENIEAKADFVFKCDDGMYENVTDDNLYSKLMTQVNKRNMYSTNDVVKAYFSENN